MIHGDKPFPFFFIENDAGKSKIEEVPVLLELQFELKPTMNKSFVKNTRRLKSITVDTAVAKIASDLDSSAKS